MALQPVFLAHGFLRGGLVVPEIAIGAQGFQFGKSRRRGIKINMLPEKVDGRPDDLDLGLRFSLHVLSNPARVMPKAARPDAARSSAPACD
jgi:hypothetical protein